MGAIYKTGDSHPKWNSLAFVEYDPATGKPVWTSVYGDSEAPYRRARMLQQRRASNTRVDVRQGSQTLPRQG